MRQAIEVSSWASWKTLLRTKLMLMKYFDNGVLYDLYLEDGTITWHYGLLKDGGTDQTDFETSYKDIRYANNAAFSATVVSLVPPSSPTDIFTLTGSATRTIQVRQILISGTRTTATYTDFVVLKRSTADSGGSSSSPTVVPHDSNSTAGTGTVKAYTANPTTGTLVGNVAAIKIMLPTATAANQNTFIWTPSYPIVLDGTSQVLAVNMNGVTASGNSLSISICWNEL